jgi:hypothetical protein
VGFLIWSFTTPPPSCYQDQGFDSYFAWPDSVGADPEFLSNWTTQMRKGLLELCVLATLKGRRLYGYDIVKNSPPSAGW